MTKYVDLLSDRQRIRDVLSRLNLMEQNDSFSVEQLAGGVSSTILKIQGPTRTYCLKQALPLLKVSKVWSAPVERVYAEIAWLQLARTILPGCSPEVLGVDRLTNSFVMNFLPPEEFGNWKMEMMAGKIDPDFAASVGRAIAQIHCATARQDQIARDFANDDNFLALRLDPYLLEVARQHPELAEPMRLLVQEIQAQKLTLVHGDMSPKNILVGPEGPVFLDAECACFSDPAFDAAFCLNHLLLKSAALYDSSALLLRAFEEFTEAYLSIVNWEPRAKIEARIARLLPALILARITGKSPVEYLDQSQRSVIFKTAVKLIRQPAMNLNDMRHAWTIGVLSHE